MIVDAGELGTIQHAVVFQHILIETEHSEKEGENMEEMVTSLLKLPVYTRNGIYVGNVRNVILDIDQRKIASLILTKTNPTLIEGAVDVAVPYRWVNAVGDIIILSYFPEKVTMEKEKEEKGVEERREESAEIETIDEPIMRE